MTSSYESWHDLDIQQNHHVEKIFRKAVTGFMKDKGYRESNGTFSREDSPGDIFHFNTKAIWIQFDFTYSGQDGLSSIWLPRYVNFPETLDVNPVMRIPDPLWGLGFVECLLDTLDTVLLDIILEKGPRFQSLKEDFRSYHKAYIEQNQDRIFTEESLKREINYLKSIPFKPERLCF